MKKYAPMKTDCKELGRYVPLREILEEVEHLKESGIEDIWFESESDGYDSTDIWIYWKRLLTDQEIKEEEDREIRYAQQRVEFERKEYLRLKEKYDGDNEN